MTVKTKILVIDDDKILGKALKIVLSMHGYDVCYVNNGTSGIQKAFEYKPDLILCDVKMGSVNGYSVYNVLKENSLIDKIPFIFISACNEPKDFRIGMDLGADDYISKPFVNEELIKIIEKKLAKFNKLKEAGRQEFNSLFNITPYGIILFDEQLIYNVNSTLIQSLSLSTDDLKTFSVGKLLDPASFNKIKDKIVRCTNGLLDSFREDVFLLSMSGEQIKASLYVSLYEKNSLTTIMIGFIILDFKSNIDNLNKPKSSIFSKREYQVLYLSMEGLSIKMIADKLSISNRTVENHRENLMKKTGSNNMIAVITFALKNNLLTFNE